MYSKNDILFPIRDSKRKKLKLASFDVETKGAGKNIFYSCGVLEDEGFFYYLSKENVIKHLFTIGKTYAYIFATNLTFDYEASFIYTQSYFLNQRIYSSSRLIGVSNDDFHLSDTLNFALMSLEKLGKSVGFHKLQKPVFLGCKPKNEKEEKELYIYNRRDCVVTLAFMNMLNDEVYALGGELKLTAGATSLYLFRRKYLKKSILKEHVRLNNPRVLELIRESMYGGRTEVFIRGKINVKSKKLKTFLKNKNPRILYYDINAMYPSVMRKKYPDSDSVRYHAKGYEKSILFFEGVSNVTVTAPDKLKIPFLPFRNKEGRLLFPIGRFRGTYTHVELRYALKIGYKINETHETIYYKRTWRPFEDYVKTMYNLRRKYQKENNPAQSVIKIFMNSLYGKFAQREITETNFYDKGTKIPDKDYMLLEGEERLKNRLHEMKDVNYVTKVKECDASHVFPVLSAHVTAYARILLYSFLSKTQPIYCDTDSIVCFKELSTSTEIGKMKLEDEFVSCNYIRPKLYTYTNKEKKIVYRGKGVPQLDKLKWNKIINGETVFYFKLLKTKEAYRRGKKPNERMEVFKRLDLQDVKRVWKKRYDKNNFESSEPIRIS